MAKIIYGEADFLQFRQENCYFVDKTDLIAELEQFKFAMFLRPRRFGKSLLASMLSHYYDLNMADRYEELFQGTKIYANPTENRNKYLILYFNFGSVSSNCAMAQESFASVVNGNILAFADKYGDTLPKKAYEIANGRENAIQKLNSLLISLRNFEHPVYVVIDEYDRFANSILAESGLDAYNAICHGDGFFKEFFSILKTENESVGSIVRKGFITGVSPLVMDDVTSGFNIGTNISSLPVFSQIVGFNHEEISQMLDYYSKAHHFDKALAYRTMIDWYDNYRFSNRQKEPVANTTQIIEHMMYLTFNRRPPEHPIDTNIRQDYSKVKHLITLNNRLNGSFAKMESLLEQGGSCCEIKDSFQAWELQEPENFTSLLYYFGLVTRNADSDSLENIVIPNATMQRMLGEIAVAAYKDVLKVNPRLESLTAALKRFALFGDFHEAKDLVSAFVEEVFSKMDCIEGEKTVQAIMATLLYTVGGPFRCYKEMELGGSFCDLVLLPVKELGGKAEHAALMELKYVKKAQKPTKPLLSGLRSEAGVQLQNYAAKTAFLAEDWKTETGRNLMFHKYCLVFQGGKLIDFSEA